VKNLCNLDGGFDDQWPWAWVQEQCVGLAPYHSPVGQTGEVHSLPGRNIHEVFVNEICSNYSGNYLIQGHFGELAPHAQAIRSWPSVRWLLITMDDPRDRELLRQRQQRLQYHPYWLDEEQIFLYRAEMYTHYFGAMPGKIYQLPVRHLWNPDIAFVLDILQRSFDLIIDPDTAQMLHHKWCDLNFGSTKDQQPT
jgi:hypothetical protein